MPKKDENVIIEEGCPSWMLTMGDSMSLLLTFFVLLLTFSRPDKDKLLQVLGGIQGALSVMDMGLSKPEISPLPTSEDSVGGELTEGGKEDVLVKKEELAVVSLRSLKVANRYSEFKERLLELGFNKFVTTQQLDQGISVEIDFDRLFITGTAELDYNAGVLLQSFANLAGSVGNELQLTACFNLDNAVSKRFSSEWTLSRERLIIVANLLYSRYNIARSRFGYGFKVISGDRPAYLRMMLLEKIGTSEVDMKELINMKNL